MWGEKDIRRETTQLRATRPSPDHKGSPRFGISDEHDRCRKKFQQFNMSPEKGVACHQNFHVSLCGFYPHCTGNKLITQHSLAGRCQSERNIVI